MFLLCKNKTFIFLFKFLIFLIIFIFFTIIISLVSSSVFYPCINHNSLIIKDVSTSKNEVLFPTILIDAGHGGEDGGAVSDSGILEKEINFDISNKIYDLFKLSNINCVLIRTDDKLLYESGQENRKKFYDINNRIKIANSYDDAILVSIHQNKFPIKKYNGFQVYYSKNNLKSKVLAEYIRNSVVENLQFDNKRPIKAADKNIRLLDSLEIPSVIAECGFLSNENEAKLLSTNEYKNKIAFLIYSAILKYVNN